MHEMFKIMTGKKTVKRIENDVREYLLYTINDVEYKIGHEDTHFETTDTRIKSLDFSKTEIQDIDIFMKIYSLIPPNIEINEPFYIRLKNFKIGNTTYSNNVCCESGRYNHIKNYTFNLRGFPNKEEIYIQIQSIFGGGKFIKNRYSIYKNSSAQYEYVSIIHFLNKIKEYGIV